MPLTLELNTFNKRTRLSTSRFFEVANAVELKALYDVLTSLYTDVGDWSYTFCVLSEDD